MGKLAATLYGFIIIHYTGSTAYLPFDSVSNSYVIAISIILENISYKRELEEIKTHPKAGYDIAKPIPLGRVIPDIIFQAQLVSAPAPVNKS